MRRAVMLLALCLTACGPAPIYVQMEIWNRTVDPVWLLDQDGRRLDVPACGHAVAPVFRVNEWAIWFDKGRWLRNSEGGSGRPPNQRYFLLEPQMRPLVDLPASGPLPELPPCQGHPSVENEHVGP